MKIEFVKHTRQGGSSDFDVLIMISGAVLSFNLLESECKSIMKFLDIIKYANEPLLYKVPARTGPTDRLCFVPQ